MGYEGLNNRLNEYIKQDYLPMHMPGHKRNPAFIEPDFAKDITEIDGFDNFHHSDGLIETIKTNVAKVWGATKAYISVNGSTGLILSSILALSASSPSKKAIVASNCHISVWHALELSGITPTIINPSLVDMPFYGPVDPESIENLLKEDSDYAFVILTSPTYEGIVSDTDSIHAITTKYNVPLIIDSAHGAHFGLSKFFPKKASGDIVINSIHKTLNAPTGTAVMLVSDALAEENLLDHYLSLTTTTSPSYVLMSGIDKCIETVSNNVLTDKWGFDVQKLRKGLNLSLKKLSLYEPVDLVCDTSKIIIMTNGYISGIELASLLRKEYKIEVEAAFPDYIIAMTGIGDNLTSLLRFSDALKNIDAKLESRNDTNKETLYTPSNPVMVMPFNEAIKGKNELCPLMDSINKVSSEYIFAYPPGVPLIFPGERITKEKAETLKSLYEKGASIVVDPKRKYSGEIRVKVDI